jgi:hypothetical protein
VNVAAHILARSCEFAVSSVISYSAPECIRQTLCMDAFDYSEVSLDFPKTANRRNPERPDRAPRTAGA